MKKALKILADNPGKIEAAQEKYKTRLAEIKAEEVKRIWSPRAIDEMRAKAADERNRTCRVLVDAIESSLATVKGNNSFEDCSLNLDDPKLNNALRILELTGGNMSYSDQANLVAQFAGDFAGLRVLEGAFKKNHMVWAAKSAHELQKPVSDQAVSEMEQVCAFFDYADANNRFDWPMGRARWTHPQFAEAAKRYGYDMDGEDDAYALSLDVTMRMLDERKDETLIEEDPEKAAKARAYLDAQRMKIKLAQAEIKNAKEKGTDPGEVFNRAMRESSILDLAPGDAE